MSLGSEKNQFGEVLAVKSMLSMVTFGSAEQL